MLWIRTRKVLSYCIKDRIEVYKQEDDFSLNLYKLKSLID